MQNRRTWSTIGGIATGLLAIAIWLTGCREGDIRIAVIPRTTALTIWEAVHAGAKFAANDTGIQVYWNAPASEDDFQQQAALVDRVIEEKYQALIIAPDQSLALLAPVQRALARGIHTVVIASPLPIPAQKNLVYIVNDDEASGRMAAMRMGEILHGSGSVAVLGVDPASTTNLTILHTFESVLEQNFPRISIIERRTGTHNNVDGQQIADEVFTSHPALNAVFTLSAVASYGALASMQARGLHGKVKLIGFEQSVELADQVRAGAMDALIAEDTYEMGYRAMSLLVEHRNDGLPPASLKLNPILLTRENIDSENARRFINRDWRSRP